MWLERWCTVVVVCLAFEFRSAASFQLNQDPVELEQMTGARQDEGRIHLPPGVDRTRKHSNAQKRNQRSRTSRKAMAHQNESPHANRHPQPSDAPEASPHSRQLPNAEKWMEVAHMKPNKTLESENALKTTKEVAEMKPNKTMKAKKARKTSRAGVEWRPSSSGQSCKTTCESEGMNCSEEGMWNVDSEPEIIGIANQLGLPCNESLFILDSNFPFQATGGQCAHTFHHHDCPGEPAESNLPTCEIATTRDIIRFCACHDEHAQGDPHLTNLRGESFDILREGVNVLLLLPQNAENAQKTELRVSASVEHPGSDSKCEGFFIVKLWIQGSLVGDDLEISTTGWDLTQDDRLAIKVGGKTFHTASEVAALDANSKYTMELTDKRSNLTMKHPRNRINFANLVVHLNGADLQIDWSTGKRKPNSLGFRATHLSALGHEWGGILGADDHSWVSSRDPECKTTEKYGQIAQLVQIERQDVASASASLA